MPYPQKITINDVDYDVVLELKKKKNSSARVCGKKIVVRISNKISKKLQQEHVSFLLDSISRKLSKRKINHDPFIFDISKENKLQDISITFDYKFEQRKTGKLLVTRDKEIKIALPQNLLEETIQEALKKMVLRALGEYYHDYLIDRVKTINDKYFNFKIKSVYFKFFKSKWGECSESGEIKINTLLLFCPVYVLDYIIIHEIGHIACLDHSKTYWTLVEKICPQRKLIERWLRRNGPRLFNMEIKY